MPGKGFGGHRYYYGTGGRYHAKKVTSPDGVFDSQREYKRWEVLKQKQASGEISGLKRQVKFELLPEYREPDRLGPRGGTIRGKLIQRAVYYIADFVYTEDGKTIVEDSKGMRTPEYKLKKKLMYDRYRIIVKET
jgi:hypothetical protein